MSAEGAVADAPALLTDASAGGVRGYLSHGSRALPLLKFQEGRPVLCEEGLLAIRAVTGAVCPVALVGDGRSGKSYLASKIVGEEGAFATDDSDVAVTEGIDVCVQRLSDGSGAHLVVFDCEGGNNAMSKSHSIVAVVGALLATTLVFVTDGKASEAAVEALARMLQERSLIKADSTGCLQAQSLFFVVNQNRLRYGEDALERILAADHDAEGAQLRELIGKAYPEGKRRFFTVPPDHKKEFEAKWTGLFEGILESAVPLKMGKLWMTGLQMVEMLKRTEAQLRQHGKVTLPSLHRHVILDSWLQPKISQVLATGLKEFVASTGSQEWKRHGAGSVSGDCCQCEGRGVDGWQDPDTDEFFCRQCWLQFSPDVLKCAFCSVFKVWQMGRVERVTKQWHCLDCLQSMGAELPEGFEW